MATLWNDQDRIAALHRYEILDSASEADFSDFVQIASDICEAPIAAINLIDSHRHWTLSGISHGDQQLPLQQSICAQAILQPNLFVVTDLSQDARFGDNPLVQGGPKLRFYAGALLQTPNGLPIGTVCVMDVAPRPDGLSDRQRFTLKALARQIMTQLELRRATLSMARGDLDRSKILQSLQEKEALLKEVHHRVKNNLQLISSLLSLQASRVSDVATASLLADSRNRLRSMALVHENLYRAGNFSEIAMRAHVRSLCAHLGQAYGSAGIAMVADSQDVALDLDRAVSCGLVINELVSNALKHAFPDGQSGRIDVSFGVDAEGQCILTVADNGVGLPDDVDIVAATSLGLLLVRDLAAQLHGEMSVERHGGTRFVLRFAKNRKAR
ncbi:MAG: Two-component sensor histidine kinase, contains HisKA and HATPase domain [Tardiphaga sp.]|nr:Two-component sensor histidine kinase, contains HisKA and HATPase domain [Tardiphaga sp.]